MKEHLIDCDDNPFVPDGWKVKSHTKGGQLAFNSTKVELYLSPNQQNGKRIKGNELLKKLASKPVLNANVLDYLLKNPHLIPEDWKKNEKGITRSIFFWGTIYIYQVSYGGLYVRCLCWDGSAWCWGCRCLDSGWLGSDPATVRRWRRETSIKTLKSSS